MLKDCLTAEILDDPGRNVWWEAVKVFVIGNSPRKSVLEYRVASWLSVNGYRRLSTLCFRRLERRYGVYISKAAEIGPGLVMPHPIGIVIGEGVVIGNNCKIFQNVTIGGKNVGDAASGRYPSIGDDVVIFAGGKVLGDISVGSHCTIGANSVVIKDVRRGSTVAGIPARAVT